MVSTKSHLKQGRKVLRSLDKKSAVEFALKDYEAQELAYAALKFYILSAASIMKHLEDEGETEAAEQLLYGIKVSERYGWLETSFVGQDQVKRAKRIVKADKRQKIAEAKSFTQLADAVLVKYAS